MGFFSEFYDHYLMNSFTTVFKSYQKIDDQSQVEILYRSFLSGEKKEISESRNWNMFRKTFQELVNIGYYSPILSFMYGIFLNADCYNRSLFYEELSQIPVSEEMDLAELCSDFFFYVKRKETALFGFQENTEKVDLYNDTDTKQDSCKSYSPKVITKAMIYFLAERIYKVQVHDPICMNDVDALARAAVQSVTEAFEKQKEEIQEENNRIAEKEKQYGRTIHLARYAGRTISEFDINRTVPGTLSDVFQLCELNGDIDLCYYILETYAWRIFSLVPWKQDRKTEVQLMSVLVLHYSDPFYSLVMSRNYALHYKSTGIRYPDALFFEELIGKKDGAILESGKQLYHDHTRLAHFMSETMTEGKQVLKRALPAYLYSFLMAFTPYMLYCSNQAEEATRFFLRQYNEINLSDKCLLYTQVLLVRCILATNHLESANTLYGYYNYEMDRQARERAENTSFVADIVEYLYEVKQYLKENMEFTIKTERSWFDVVFSDGTIDRDLILAAQQIKSGTVIEESLFRRLMTYVDAFSYETGIRLGVLNLPNEDGYDKLQDALSKELTIRGQGYMQKFDEFMAFYQGCRQLDIRENINIVLQSHISKLAENSLEESLTRIKALKDSMGKNENNPELSRKLDEICEELTSKLHETFAGRAEVELYISNLQHSFVTDYCGPGEDANLLLKLPLDLQQDIYKYLVTSEIVFRMLSSREDACRLDFSPALISLTKAIELVLNHIFHQMKVRVFPGIDFDIKASFFYKNKNIKKDGIEFGQGIYLLKDSQYINAVKKDGVIQLFPDGRMYNPSHFLEWNGNDVVDIAKLKKFHGVDVKIGIWDSTSRRNVCAAATFANDDKYNRMLLVKALEYIKDNYRNIVAHKDPVSQTQVKECRKLLLLTESLLWILVYILK